MHAVVRSRFTETGPCWGNGAASEDVLSPRCQVMYSLRLPMTEACLNFALKSCSFFSSRSIRSPYTEEYAL